MLGQTRAVERARCGIEAGKSRKPLFGLVPGGDDAHQAMGPGGLTARIGKPAARILDPGRTAPGGVSGRQRVADMVGNAAAYIYLGRSGDSLVAGLRTERAQQIGIGPAGRKRLGRGKAEHVGDVRAPDETIAGEVPIVDDLADRIQDRRAGRVPASFPRMTLMLPAAMRAELEAGERWARWRSCTEPVLEARESGHRHDARSGLSIRLPGDAFAWPAHSPRIGRT